MGRTASGSIPLGWAPSGPIPLGQGVGNSGALTFTGGIGLGRRRKPPPALRFDPVVKGRGLARLSRRPQPTTASELQRACVRWIVTLWVMVILLQRFQLPNQEIAVLLPVTILWAVYGLVRGVLEIDKHRLGWWLGASGLSAAFAPFQLMLVPRVYVSVTSWGLLVVTWLVFVFRLRDRRRETYVMALRGIVRVSMWFAGLVIVMFASQLVIPYSDWFADIVPASIRLKTFTIAYPISYGSPYFKANGWIGLEPSVVSFQFGVALVAALLIRATMPIVFLLGAAILCTTAGSGVVIVAIAVVVIMFSSYRWALARYLILIPPVLAFAATPWAEPIMKRTKEFTGDSGSNNSTNLRAIAPYDVLWPKFTHDPMTALFGGGPGSSQQIITNQHVLGLLVPTPLKIFFDYGVIAGLALATFLTVHVSRRAEPGDGDHAGRLVVDPAARHDHVGLRRRRAAPGHLVDTARQCPDRRDAYPLAQRQHRPTGRSAGPDRRYGFDHDEDTDRLGPDAGPQRGALASPARSARF